MYLELSKKELVKLHSKFKDYKHHKKGCKIFLLKGLLFTFGLFLLMMFVEVSKNGFRFHSVLILAFAFFVIYLLILFPLWHFVVIRNAKEMEKKFLDEAIDPIEFEKQLQKKMDETFTPKFLRKKVNDESSVNRKRK